MAFCKKRICHRTKFALIEIPQIAIEKYSVFLMKYQDIDTMSDKNDSA